MRTMRVRDVMTSRVVAVTPSTPFRDVAELMLHHEIGAIPVIDDSAGLIGLISEADLLAKQAYGDRRRHHLLGMPGVAGQEARGMVRSRAQTARELMSAPVDTALPDEPLRDVARRMVENRLRHLVVVDGARRMVGIVSRRDLLQRVRSHRRRDRGGGADRPVPVTSRRRWRGLGLGRRRRRDARRPGSRSRRHGRDRPVRLARARGRRRRPPPHPGTGGHVARGRPRDGPRRPSGARSREVRARAGRGPRRRPPAGRTAVRPSAAPCAAVVGGPRAHRVRHG